MVVESHVYKQGDCLSVSIPLEVARKWGLRAGAPVEIQQRDGEIVVRKKAYDLDLMLSQITEDNLHPEIDTGPPVGKEGW